MCGGRRWTRGEKRWLRKKEVCALEAEGGSENHTAWRREPADAIGVHCFVTAFSPSSHHHLSPFILPGDTRGRSWVSLAREGIRWQGRGQSDSGDGAQRWRGAIEYREGSEAKARLENGKTEGGGARIRTHSREQPATGLSRVHVVVCRRDRESRPSVFSCPAMPPLLLSSRTTPNSSEHTSSFHPLLLALALARQPLPTPCLPAFSAPGPADPRCFSSASRLPCLSVPFFPLPRLACTSDRPLSSSHQRPPRSVSSGTLVSLTWSLDSSLLLALSHTRLA